MVNSQYTISGYKTKYFVLFDGMGHRAPFHQKRDFKGGTKVDFLKIYFCSPFEIPFLQILSVDSTKFVE